MWSVLSEEAGCSSALSARTTTISREGYGNLLCDLPETRMGEARRQRRSSEHEQPTSHARESQDQATCIIGGPFSATMRATLTPPPARARYRLHHAHRATLASSRSPRRHVSGPVITENSARAATTTRGDASGGPSGRPPTPTATARSRFSTWNWASVYPDRGRRSRPAERHPQ